MRPLSLLSRSKLWIPPLLYMALIFHLSSESNPLPELTAHVWDKFLHTAEYIALAFLFCRALVGEGLGWLAALVATMLMTSLYGASDEWHQAFVPLRDSNVLDWFADDTGAALGALAFLALRRLRSVPYSGQRDRSRADEPRNRA